MLAAVTDIDLLTIAMRIALGDEVVFDELPQCAQVVYVLLAQAPVWMRRIVAVDGLDQLRADPSVRRAILLRGPGQSVDWRPLGTRVLSLNPPMGRLGWAECGRGGLLAVGGVGGGL
jgi:hypothetical protein